MLHYACLHFVLVEMGTTMVLLRLAHDCILAHIVTGSYNKLLPYFVLFTFEHASHICVCLKRLTPCAETGDRNAHSNDKGKINHLDSAS